MKHRTYSTFATLAAAALAGSALGCSDGALSLDGVSSFDVKILKVNGADPPALDAPLPANIGITDERWEFEVVAVDAAGNETGFEGFARFRVEPGSVNAIEGEGAVGRNAFFVDGKSTGTALVTTVFGPSRLWVEDVGYVPVPVSAPPKCADGKDNDDDGVIDYPADPGCAFADDDTEGDGTFAAGVSDPVHYALPRIADIQGTGTETPYPFEGIEVSTGEPQYVVVTRLSSDGFYATDMSGPEGASNSLFAFNFNTPVGMRPCDRLTYFSGTLSEFFGFTEISFPSYDVVLPTKACKSDADCTGEIFDCNLETEICDKCKIMPDPVLLTAEKINDAVLMESLESALVRIEGFTIASNFGAKNPEKSIMCDFGWCFGPDASNCDLNGDGAVDFENPDENSCANTCSDDPNCSEWTGFSARGNYKASAGPNTQIQIQTASVTEFDPPSFRGQTIQQLTGTMRNFSGGSLNWTIETRCPDDLVCTFSDACSKDDKKPSIEACVRPRTKDDNEATN